MDFLDVFYEENTMLLVDPVMGDDGRTYGIYSAALLDGRVTLETAARMAEAEAVGVLIVVS